MGTVPSFFEVKTKMASSEDDSRVDSDREKSLLGIEDRGIAVNQSNLRSEITPEFGMLKSSYSYNKSCQSEPSAKDQELRAFIAALMQSMLEDDIRQTKIKELFTKAVVKFTAEGHSNAVISRVVNDLLKNVPGLKFYFNFVT